MLYDQDFPRFLWAEACNTMVYIQNRTAHRALGKQTLEGICCRADWHDNAQTGGCHSDPRSLRLSLSPTAKGGSPCEMMKPTVDQLVGRHETRLR